MSGLLRLGMKALPSIARWGSKVFGSGGKVDKFLGMAAAGTAPQIIDEGKKLHSSVSDTFNKSKDAVSQLKQKAREPVSYDTTPIELHRSFGP